MLGEEVTRLDPSLRNSNESVKEMEKVDDCIWSNLHRGSIRTSTLSVRVPECHKKETARPGVKLHSNDAVFCPDQGQKFMECEK